MELTAEERQRILAEIHQREFLEREALAQEKAAKKQQAELEYRQSLAAATQRAEAERQERLKNNLTTSIKLLQDALEAFQQGDESKTYRLLVRTDSFLIGAKQGINQTPQRPSNGSLPTVRVKANNPQGFAIINAEDLTPAHEVLEDSK